jgi:alpha-glucosidase
MLDTLRFWLERGVDGFRIDVLSLLVEDDQLHGNPVSSEFREGDWPYLRQRFTYTHDQPETRDLAMRIRKVVDEYGDDKVLLAELVVPIEALAAYHGADGHGIQVPFNFELREADWNARGIAAFVDRYLAVLPPGPGRTGCSATMTPRGWAPGSARPRPGWPRCCCPPCPAPRSCTTATRSA